MGHGRYKHPSNCRGLHILGLTLQRAQWVLRAHGVSFWKKKKENRILNAEFDEP